MLLKILITVLMLMNISIASTRGQIVDFLIAGTIKNNGQPNSYGYVKFYTPGTTTFKNIYTDRNKTSIASQPIRLDVRGGTELYADGEYYIVYTDSAGVTIDTVSYGNYSAAVDFGGIYVDVLGSYGNTASDINLAIADTIASENYIFLFKQSEYSIASNVTFPSNVELRFQPNAYFTISSGISVKLTSTNIESYDGNPIFRGSGQVTGNVSNSIINAKWFCYGDDIHDDSVGFQNAANLVGDNKQLKVPGGQYLLTNVVDFVGKSNFSIIGDHRISTIKFNHSDLVGFDFGGSAAMSYRRGIRLEGLNFFANAVDSDIPSIAIRMDYSPEFQIKDCMFIDCATSKLTSFDWSFAGVIDNCFFSADEDLQSNYGAPRQVSANGYCIFVNQEGHNMSIKNNRIRTGTPCGIYWGGGDASTIRENAIESNKSIGIIVAGSCRNLLIDNNYFEGQVSIDIRYLDSATNLSHHICNNYLHGGQMNIQLGGTEYNGMVINNNHFYSSAIGIKYAMGDATNRGVKIVDNYFRDVSTNFQFSNNKLYPLDYPGESILIDNYEDATGGIDLTLSADPIYPMPVSVSLDILSIGDRLYEEFWGRYTLPFNGTATINRTVNYKQHATITALTASKDVCLFYCDIPDGSYLNNTIMTIGLSLNTPSGNFVSVNISDLSNSGSSYICKSGTGNNFIDNLFYYRMAPTSDRMRILLSTDVTLNPTVNVSVPTIFKGVYNKIRNLMRKIW